MAATDHRVSAVFAPALTIGVGLGGFVDGIVLHQILGWHHMLSGRPGFDMRANELADGLFHAGAWLVVLAGVLWLYARLRLPPVPAAWPRLATGPRPWRVLIGAMLAGWGLFNVVEGLIDHQVLGLHHVRPGAHQLAWDVGFLAFGAVLAGVGFLMARPYRLLNATAASITWCCRRERRRLLLVRPTRSRHRWSLAGAAVNTISGGPAGRRSAFVREAWGRDRPGLAVSAPVSPDELACRVGHRLPRHAPAPVRGSPAARRGTRRAPPIPLTTEGRAAPA